MFLVIIHQIYHPVHVQNAAGVSPGSKKDYAEIHPVIISRKDGNPRTPTLEVDMIGEC